MIRLTRLNHHEIALNCDLIEWAEAVPDTCVRMVSGESIMVLETVEEVIERITEYRRSLLKSAGLAAILTSGWRSGTGYLTRDDATSGAREGSSGPRRATPVPVDDDDDEEERR